MKFCLLSLLALCIVALVMTMPLAAQTGSSQSQMANDRSSDIVPGTGVTQAELRDLGYTPQQIAEIRSTSAEMAEQGAGTAADESSGRAQLPSENQPMQARDRGAARAEGGNGWGLWGLIGLLGLLGLGGRSRRAEAREERDIRRVA
ncbi:MAG: hypothetical protein ACE14L_11665 [Terriglobales bacterium]